MDNGDGTTSADSSSANGNSLIEALAGDAAKVATGYFAADAAKTAVKKNPNSATTIVLVAGGIAALFIVLVLAKKS